VKTLVIGANGQVGHALLKGLAPQGGVIATTRSGLLADGGVCEALDVTDLASLANAIGRLEPDLVINASAYTAVDRAEDEPELAHRVNAMAPGALAAACARAGIGLVHFSTDYVFDGQGTRPYREDDAKAPLGVYGASKWAGEQAVRDSGAAHKIFRLCWVYGPRGNNFLLTMLRLARERGHVKVVSDQVGTPTSASLIAGAVAHAVAQRPKAVGTWHLAAGGECSWHGFAEAIFGQAQALGLLPAVPVLEAITSRDYPTRAVRPAYSRLDTSCFRRDFGLHPGDWREGLQQVLSELAGQAPAA
jgi:dTDP-4-dehydrorhamnose reductase